MEGVGEEVGREGGERAEVSNEGRDPIGAPIASESIVAVVAGVLGTSSVSLAAPCADVSATNPLPLATSLAASSRSFFCLSSSSAKLSRIAS